MEWPKRALHGLRLVKQLALRRRHDNTLGRVVVPLSLYLSLPAQSFAAVMALCTGATIKSSILIVGQYVPTSGLTSVLEYLIGHLKHCFRISLIGLYYRGQRLNGGARIYPDVLSDRENADPRRTNLEAVFEAENPDIVFLFNDVSSQAFCLRRVRAAAGQCRKIVTYTAVDGEVVKDELFSGLSGADRCVFFSEFGKRQAARYIAASRLGIIPHGVDTALFYPYPGSVDAQFEGDCRRSVRRVLFSKRPDLIDAFIVLNANRPWLRKRVDLTMEGFALFARDKPANVKLFLHHPRTNDRERARILRMGRNLGISERLLLNPIVGGKSEVSVENLNLLYNACDIGVNTAMGEGWGLVSFEHAATGAPQIIPRHSACADIWEEAAEFLEPVDDDVFLFSAHCRLKTVAAEDLSVKLEKLYRERDYRCSMATSAYHRVTQPKYQWASIAKQWEALFTSLVRS
jgi:glycosyltransferase involved in cell wall biosynthesis